MAVRGRFEDGRSVDAVKFWASSEVYGPADAALNEIRQKVEAYLNFQFSNSTLNALDVTLRYVPTVMPEFVRANYPERTKLRKKARIYDCAPQLDFETFVSGDARSQLAEYIRGFSDSASSLRALGATGEQIEDFQRIVTEALKELQNGGKYH
jgi:hypothetical protein